MAGTSDAFLQGQGMSVALSDVESELTRLWGPAAEQVGGPDLDRPSVTRVVLANLIVARALEGCDRVGAVLDALASHYPCRTIVLRPTANAGRNVFAEVSALCHLPAPGMPQVCSERITLCAGPEARDLLPGAVRPLLEADLPCVLWWADVPTSDDPLLRDLSHDATRVLLDPPAGVDARSLGAALDPARHPFARDVAWYGITRWRELIAGLFDPPDARRALGAIASVEVLAHSSNVDCTPRPAAWLAAWLAGQLGWTPLRRETPEPGRIEASFQGPSGEVAVRIVTAAGPPDAMDGLSGVSGLAAGPWSFRLDRPDLAGAEVKIALAKPGQERSSRTVHSPEPDDAGRLAAALESTRDDPPFLSALPNALWLLGA